MESMQLEKWNLVFPLSTIGTKKGGIDGIVIKPTLKMLEQSIFLI